MPEVAQVRCDVCGAKWDPRQRLLGAMGCPNAIDHPVVHELRGLCRDALRALEEHDSEYHYVTPPELLARLATATATPPREEP